MKNVRKFSAYTLMEMVIVLAVIGVVVLMAMPSQLGKHTQLKIVENIELVEPYKANIEAFYRATGLFPEDNEQASIPLPEKIVGNYLTEMYVENGAMHLVLGQKLNRLENQIITIFPVYVKDSLSSPITWICGYDEIPAGLLAAGENKTDVKKNNLPLRCR